jgi:hypothetical protein
VLGKVTGIKARLLRSSGGAGVRRSSVGSATGCSAPSRGKAGRLRRGFGGGYGADGGRGARFKGRGAGDRGVWLRKGILSGFVGDLGRGRCAEGRKEGGRI